MYVRGDSRSYTILLTSRAIKAFEGAGLKLPPDLLNQLVGSCSHLPNGKKVTNVLCPSPFAIHLLMGISCWLCLLRKDSLAWLANLVFEST